MTDEDGYIEYMKRLKTVSECNSIKIEKIKKALKDK